PLLFQVASGGSLNQSQVSVLESDSINTFDMIINNQQLVDHPFHLHALKFWVVARGNGTMSPAGLKHVKLNLNNPIRRDVTVVAGGGWAVLRFITDIPGVHLFHCHILWHQVVGLGGVFVSQRPEILEMKFPQETLNLCAAENWAPGTSKNTTAVGSMKRAKVQAQKRVALRLEAGKKEKKRGTGHWSERLGRKLSKVARKVVCLKGSTTGARIGA
ncbi:diphenol oxidase, partial [Pseudohyphozyma bogoriensis]